MSNGAGDFLSRLRNVCDALAKGDYSGMDELFGMTIEDGIDRDLHELAETFANMTVQIEAREFRLSNMLAELKEAHRQLEAAHRSVTSENVTLRSQVQQLTIEIDQGRKEREVNEIVETDYFQMLQERARIMRQRHAIDATDATDGNLPS